MGGILELAAAALLLAWSARQVVRAVRRQWKGGCGGDCAGCGRSCRKRRPKGGGDG